MTAMHLVGIRLEPPGNQPVLLLREADGPRYLPIWIGQAEAAAIALHQSGAEPPRPLTHDLIVNLVNALGARLVEVRIVDMQEGTFYAVLSFADGLRVSARPSDAVAVAIRAGAPIVAEESVLAEAGIEIPDAEEASAEPAGEPDEVEKFKEFLDTISPEDFKAEE